MYTDAEQIIEAGHEGKWLKVSPEEEAAVIRSIPGANLVRGSKGHSSLRHYTRDGHIAVHSRLTEVETHPHDKESPGPAPTKEKAMGAVAEWPKDDPSGRIPI
jgi:hypothetical protein